MKRRATGETGEKLAGDFLKGRGYSVIETNFRAASGEIDLITQKGDYLVFVEVRTRRSSSFGSPEESVTPSKKSHLISAAQEYCQTHPGLPELWRIDFVGIELDRQGKPLRISLIENAVSEA